MDQTVENWHQGNECQETSETNETYVENYVSKEIVSTGTQM